MRCLLEAGANPNALNSFGSCPLLEACRSGHDNICDLLVHAGAHLNQPPVEEAALLSTVIHAKKHELLRRLLRAGADPANGDYDGRTPLHIAAATGTGFGVWGCGFWCQFLGAVHGAVWYKDMPVSDALASLEKLCGVRYCLITSFHPLRCNTCLTAIV